MKGSCTNFKIIVVNIIILLFDLYTVLSIHQPGYLNGMGPAAFYGIGLVPFFGKSGCFCINKKEEICQLKTVILYCKIVVQIYSLTGSWEMGRFLRKWSNAFLIHCFIGSSDVYLFHLIVRQKMCILKQLQQHNPNCPIPALAKSSKS